jgi:hypothetical protein
MSVLTITLSVTVLSLPSSATAGLNDPPPASLPVHVYSVPGAMKSDKLDTVVACTDVDSVSVGLNVQYYDRFGVLLNPTGPTFSIQPGESLHFATALLPSIPLDVQWNTGTFVGSARVVATSKKLLCTAFILDNTSNPPISMMQLPVIRKVLQKGD